MAVDSGLGLGFLVGSLALLAVVLYMTRIRGPSLPHERMGEADAEVDAVTPAPGAPTDRAGATATERCELCGERRAVKSVNDLDVCAECDEDLLT